MLMSKKKKKASQANPAGVEFEIIQRKKCSYICLFVCVRARVCLCVCVCKRESKKEKGEREKMSMLVSVK